MPRPTTTTSEPSPRRTPHLRTGIAQPPVVTRPAPVIRSQPAPLVRCASNPLPPAPTSPAPRPPRTRWSRVARVLFGLMLGVLGIIGLLTILVLMGQTVLVAWIIVGAVIVIVFGTPLLCLLGLIACYVWAMTRLRRPRSPARPTPSPAAAPAEHPVIVGEVVFDD
jgi:predicted lipid-binding transport protein (Tim44 family)